MEKIKLIPFNEIVAAIALPKLNDETYESFMKNPNDFINNFAELDSGISLHTVTNTKSQVHLALPYYSIVEEVNAKMMEDTQIDDIIGGEIVIGLAVFGGYALAAAAGAGSIASTIIGGVVGATTALVIAGSAAGAVAAIHDGQGKNFVGKKK